MSRSARVQKVDDDLVDSLQEKWELLEALKCDTDHWILALAEACGTRILVTNDNAVIEDFRTHLRGVSITPTVVRDRKTVQQILVKYR